MIGPTRKAIHDALTMGLRRQNSGMVEYLTYLSKIDKCRDSGIWHLVENINLAKILAEIHAQPPVIASWLEYCYGPDCPPEYDFHQGTVAHALLGHLEQPNGVKQHDRHRKLCMAACEDYRLRMRQGRQLPIEVYGSGMGVEITHWARDWAKKCDLLLDHIHTLDTSGVANISKVVGKIREAECDQ